MYYIKHSQGKFQRSHSKIYHITFVVLLVITLLLSSFSNAQVEVVWYYQFDDISELDNWSVTTGAVTIDNGELIGTDCESFDAPYGTFCFTRIAHNLSTSAGTWSFDYYRSNPNTSVLFSYFMARGEALSGPYPFQGHMLAIRTNDSLSFGYFNDGGTTSRTDYVFQDSLVNDFYEAQWIHVEFSRFENGTMIFTLNGIEVARRSSNFDDPERIDLAFGSGDRIDNLRLETSLIQDTVPDPQDDTNDGKIELTFALIGVGVVSIAIITYLAGRYIKKKE